MLMLNELKIALDAVTVEKQILENDLTVMNIVLKNILNSKVEVIDGVPYFKAEDIVAICNEGFKSLSSKIMKEKESNR